MKTHVAGLAALLCAFRVSAQDEVHAAGAQASANTVAQSPFVCAVDVFTPAERKRHFDVLGPALIAKRTAVVELADGYELQLPSDKETFAQLSEYIDGERACCPFFDIGVRMSSEHGPITVGFTGRPGTKQFIEGDAKGWISPVAAAK